MADQQKILCYSTKYAFLRIIYTLSIFSLGCIKTPWGDANKFGTILAHLSQMKIYFCLSICWAVLKYCASD